MPESTDRFDIDSVKALHALEDAARVPYLPVAGAGCRSLVTPTGVRRSVVSDSGGRCQDTREPQADPNRSPCEPLSNRR